MKKNCLDLVFIVCLCLGFVACSDDDDSPKQTQVTFICTSPDGLDAPVVSNVIVTLKNVNTGKESVFPQDGNGLFYKASANEGLYNVSLEGDISYSLDGTGFSSKVRAYKESVQLAGITMNSPLEMYLHNSKSGFVLAEIFFTGTETPEGKQYNGDKYFKIYNNSDELLYADSLVIAESAFMTVSKYDYTPNIMSQSMAVHAIYMIPGDGKKYPVEPGKSVLICDNAQVHTKANPNSFDLTKADFEWYDESSNPYYTDVDNPDVTNLDKIFCYTLTIWSPHNRGFRSYALAKLGVDRITYLTDYTYHYDYNMVLPTGTYPMSGDCYRLPNDWILDAVNLSVGSMFQWIVTDPSLDQGWTYCGSIDSDLSRFGKSVRRKVLSTLPDGRKILKDTNNSTVDFAPEQKADPYYQF